ncbi:hypothetical protein QTP88_020188 [Uroleucon formosanum]
MNYAKIVIHFILAFYWWLGSEHTETTPKRPLFLQAEPEFYIYVKSSLKVFTEMFLPCVNMIIIAGLD